MNYATGSSPLSVAIGDLNGDARPNLAVANFAGSASVLLNRGGGRFNAKVDYAARPLPRSIAIGDLNGDGKLDLATATPSLGNRIRAREPRQRQPLGRHVDYAAGHDPASVAIGDLNGDGRPDLTTARLLR